MNLLENITCNKIFLRVCKLKQEIYVLRDKMNNGDHIDLPISFNYDVTYTFAKTNMTINAWDHIKNKGFQLQMNNDMLNDLLKTEKELNDEYEDLLKQSGYHNLNNLENYIKDANDKIKDLLVKRDVYVIKHRELFNDLDNKLTDKLNGEKRAR